MPDIHDQLAWEEQMVQHGVERYRAQQDNAVEGGRTSETSAGSRLLRSYVLQIADHIDLYLDGKHPDGRRRNNYAKLLATLDADKVAMFALKAVISTLFNPTTTQTVCINIGKMCEDEQRFLKFATEHKEYYDQIVRDWERRNTTDLRHRHRVIVNKSNEKGLEWLDWTKEVHFRVGSLVLSLLMEVCDLVKIEQHKIGKGRTEAVLVPTEACIEWVMAHNEQMEVSNPQRMPCLIPPEDWTDLTHGGYYSPRMRSRTAMVKTRQSKAGKETRDLLNKADLTPIFSALNAMQRTGWTINHRVMDVMREVWHKNLHIGMPRSQPYEIPPCPLAEGIKPAELEDGCKDLEAFQNWKAEARELHTMEKERVSQNLSLTRTMRMATAMSSHKLFHFVYQCDFRGRVYCATSGLSPQGTDHGKALLMFAEGKPLGDEGFYWLKVHGANKYGYDKEDYDVRVKWIDDKRTALLAAADDPIAHREIWAGADKPYQFLAFIFEYANAVRNGPGVVSYLPVALDGSCNGLQHFSAMLRDRVGGSAVNLTPSLKPSDIYQAVADVCTRKLKGLRSLNTEETGGAVNWLDFFSAQGEERMPRKLSKKPVMTLPYGSTQQACTETIYRWIQETDPEFFEKNTAFKHSLYLSPKLWASISEVVIAARQAMDWVQACAGVLAKAGHPIQFVTPLGFPMYQATRQFKTKQIDTQVAGRLQLRFAVDIDKLDSRKQRQGSSPNLVHSIDATHMMMVIIAAVKAGISSFAMIHDDFGVHACDTVKFHKIIREEFVKLHTNFDVLAEFKRQHEELYDIDLPDLPPKGDLDLTEVLNSPFFFG